MSVLQVTLSGQGAALTFLPGKGLKCCVIPQADASVPSGDSPPVDILDMLPSGQ